MDMVREEHLRTMGNGLVELVKTAQAWDMQRELEGMEGEDGGVK